MARRYEIYPNRLDRTDDRYWQLLWRCSIPWLKYKSHLSGLDMVYTSAARPASPEAADIDYIRCLIDTGNVHSVARRIRTT